ncbi:hypothetical protein NC99_43220 [Sunxiuqinia dokdonensis]|uniref:Uncharacterized protein n=1 Tax=Sunxiuqinia dokdonensis TaxID=1409788 RepID=A0A0L8V390_9BACT|nr:hypothetical protein NC99_43220 [Sunxiuqinia dokdonensis]
MFGFQFQEWYQQHQTEEYATKNHEKNTRFNLSVFFVHWYASAESVCCVFSFLSSFTKRLVRGKVVE